MTFTAPQEDLRLAPQHVGLEPVVQVQPVASDGSLRQVRAVPIQPPARLDQPLPRLRLPEKGQTFLIDVGNRPVTKR